MRVNLLAICPYCSTVSQYHIERESAPRTRHFVTCPKCDGVFIIAITGKPKVNLIGHSHGGLDVRQVQSGTSVHKLPRISKRGNANIRRILYMPALVAVQHEPHVRTFYEQLLNAGKKPLQALVAVMRKLLHAIYGMLKTNTDFDGQKFRTLPKAA